jgi:hypothetical protein
MRAPNVRMKLLPAAVTVLLACGAAGCSGGGGGHSDRPAADGPLSSGVNRTAVVHGSACAPGGGPRTFGLEDFVNYGHTTVVLDRVTLQRPRNIRVLAVYAVPGRSEIGVWSWPPHYRGLPAEWKDRQPVPGFRLAPGKQFVMVWGLQARNAGSRASARGMLVYYHDSAGSYVATDDFGMTIGAGKGGC